MITTTTSVSVFTTRKQNANMKKADAQTFVLCQSEYVENLKRFKARTQYDATGRHHSLTNPDPLCSCTY